MEVIGNLIKTAIEFKKEVNGVSNPIEEQQTVLDKLNHIFISKAKIIKERRI